MTNLLLKTKTEQLKWQQQQHCNVMGRREKERERARERERDTGSDSGGEFWEAAGIYIHFLVSIQSSLN